MLFLLVIKEKSKIIEGRRGINLCVGEEEYKGRGEEGRRGGIEGRGEE